MMEDVIELLVSLGVATLTIMAVAAVLILIKAVKYPNNVD